MKPQHRIPPSKLRGLSATFANFWSANLKTTDLGGTYLHLASFSKANLKGTNLKATVREGENLPTKARVAAKT
jgi:uncharacterized protein YjbI with pentapeptide repeats